VPLVLLVLFFLSGATSLVLEAVFLREATWTLGSAASATSLVLAAFLAGLALGAALLGRVADRSSRPLRLYGLLEIGGGLGAILAVWVLGPGRQAVLVPAVAASEPALGRAATFAIAFLVLLVPASLLGGTLPALAKVATRDPGDGVHQPIALLYGINTLGGAVGVFLAGFFLFESTGVTASGYLAGAVGLVVGASAILLDRSGAVAAGRPPARRERAASRDGLGPRVRAACLVAAGIGGAAALGYEVVWTRLLSLPMRSYAYSFSVMLTIFLAGIVVGSLAVHAFASRLREPLRLVGWSLALAGLYVASSLVWLPRVLSPPEGATSFAGFLIEGALRAAVVVLPPTFLSGAALPLATLGIVRGTGSVGRDVGTLFAANTVGGIVGALAAGLVLLPWVGAPRSLALLAIASVVAGLLVLVATAGSSASRAAAWVALAACTAALLLPAAPFERAFVSASIGREKISDVLFFREGASDTIAIVEKDYGFHDASAKSLVTNGIAMSATVKPVWRYMAVEGHLPVLLARDPSRALVVCIGTGITLAAVASHERLRAIDAVELSEGVIEGLPWFEAENGGVVRDPRVHLVREDGRHFLELSRERYDVITVEPPPPIVAGSVHLYSLDFYEVCKRRLAAGGVVAQWLPLHAQSLESARMTARTFLAAFPHAQLWLPSIRDAVLVGSSDPLSLDLDRLRAAYAAGPSRASLEGALLESPAALLGTYLLDRDGIARWAGDAPLVTDEHPRMEFFRPSGSNMSDRDIASLLAGPDPSHGWVVGLGADAGLAREVERESRALRAYARAGAGSAPGGGVEAARLSRGTEFFLYPLGCTSEQLGALSRMPGPEVAYRTQLARCRSIREDAGAPGS
jgi:spermidine synthase